MSKEKPLNPLTMTDEELIEHCDKQVQALRMALDMIECEKHDRRHVRWAIVDALKEWKPALAKQPAQQEPPVKLKVTLEDRPIDIELAQYKRMFEAACSALGSIGDALGIDPEEGGAEPILVAISELKAVQPAQRKPLTDDELADLWFKQSLDWMEFARAIEAAHGITGEKK